MAHPDHIAIVKQGAEAIRQWQNAHPNECLDLQGAELPGISLSSAPLVGVNLQGANLHSIDLRNADLTNADLSGAVLRRAHLQEANLSHAQLQHADLFEARLSRADLQSVKGLRKARYLETALLGEGDPQHVETCERQPLEYWLDWERLRTLGRLPLFGLSYTTVLLVPLVMYGLAQYNDKVEYIRLIAAHLTNTADHPLSPIAALTTKHLRPLPIPSQSLLLLVSSVFLAAASTIYAAACPTIVKDFSRSQWVYQLGRPLVHYWAQTWKYRWLRVVCAVCYLLGGLGAF
jgi:uncharacterized protein YjbI with pentapeptide repeats